MSILSTISLGLLALPTLISAIPIEYSDISAVAPADFASIKLYEQYAAASYANSNIQGTGGTPVVCAAYNCPDVEKAGATTYLQFIDNGKSGCSGFVAIDTTNNLIVLSFRGTQSVSNIEADLMLGQVETDLCDGCKSHEGFWLSWTEVRDLVIPVIERLSEANKGFKVVSTGHSLGAAIATNAAIELRTIGFIVDLATYGSPRVGNHAYVQHAQSQEPERGRNFRVTHMNDPAPNSPPSGLDFNGMYEHISPTYFIQTDNIQTPTIYDMTVLSGNVIENQIDSQTTSSQQADAHNFYINSISASGSTSVMSLMLANISTLGPVIVNTLNRFPDLTNFVNTMFPGLPQLLKTVMPIFNLHIGSL